MCRSWAHFGLGYEISRHFDLTLSSPNFLPENFTIELPKGKRKFRRFYVSSQVCIGLCSHLGHKQPVGCGMNKPVRSVEFWSVERWVGRFLTIGGLWETEVCFSALWREHLCELMLRALYSYSTWSKPGFEERPSSAPHDSTDIPVTRQREPAYQLSNN